MNDKEWLEWFLNHAAYIDPYDDEAYLVDMLLPYATLLRSAYSRISNK